MEEQTVPYFPNFYPLSGQCFSSDPFFLQSDERGFTLHSRLTINVYA